MRRIKVTVTEDDIANGVAKDGSRCPVGLACKRADIDDPCFENPGLEYWAGYKHLTVKLPKAAREFADAFDAGRPVQPFEFEIELPGSYYEQDGDE
jgi:hypothetical protein